MTLFDSFSKSNNKFPGYAPLADRIRPLTLDDFVGQEHLVGQGKILRQIIESDKLYSMIFWGPPGSGKTTIARIIEVNTKNKFVSFSAVTSGIKQIKDVMDIASYEMKQNNIKTILFVDEIHRFNKAQQDAFLPFVENGTIILIGATTENPSFEINSALLSRCKVFIFNKLSEEDIIKLLNKALSNTENGLGSYNFKIEEEALRFIARFADGDARIAYNTLELAFNYFNSKEGLQRPVNSNILESIIQKKALLYDKNGEEHFNLISALHKSMRGSDADAAAYWTLRMIEGGEDPLYIIRRIVRFAAEDIGLADTNALTVALAAKESFEFIGPPEGFLAIIEAAIYCALAPKSNSLYKAYNNIMEDIKNYLSLPVPMHIRNAPTKLMKDVGYGNGYKYPHNYENAIVNQSYLPEKLKSKKYYMPTERGFEKILKERILKINEYKNKLPKD
ncbi:MAG: replication-associated recombination protein A [Actinobacteria bacterium]|nr:replication-associated recombination protein A [Actinomycetota bacterium]